MCYSIRITLFITVLAASILCTSCGGGSATTASTSTPTNPTTPTPNTTHSFVAITSIPQRWESTATLLDSGNVLIAGGTNGSGEPFCPDATFPNASLFNPATSKFKEGAALMEMRYFHTATLLEDGKVLLIGGGPKCNGTLTSAEIYDPTTEIFSRTGSLSTGRSAFTATRLEDGRVLVVGGWEDIRTAEIYNPASATFTPAGSLATGRTFHTATLLPNGKVLIFGGMTSGTPWIVPSAEVFDPQTNSFEPPIPVDGRMRHTATLLPDGTVLIAGGDNLAGAVFDSVERFNPSTGAVTPAGTLSAPRYWHTATLLPLGLVLFVGGDKLVQQSGGTWSEAIASTEIYDPITQRSSAGPSLNYARAEHNATLLKDGRVLITDGGALWAEVYQ